MQRDSLSAALAAVKPHIADPRKGLPEEVFLFVSAITPLVNVDLLVRNAQGHILLSWRNDVLCGQGWHVPGGIVRFQEGLVTRLQKTALAEFGCEVILEPREPEFAEFIRPAKNPERSHFISFIYHCRLPEGIVAPPHEAAPGEAGYLEFHEFFPENMIPVHHFYRKYFRSQP